MARKPRIHYPGAIYHVMLRGNAKQTIFHRDEEYRYFEDILAQGLEQYSLMLHAYCWMENHVHMARPLHNSSGKTVSYYKNAINCNKKL